MNTPAKPSMVKTALSLTRIPVLLLVCGLGNYALLRGLAPAVDPSDLSNIIGMGALIEVALITAAMRFWKRKQEASTDEK